MNALEVLAVLRAKGVTVLHHANTVQTACTYLRAGALLSRAEVEKRRLHQTKQSSDDLDKHFGIWNDIFLDGVDIHYRSKTKNHYGPVCFEFDIDSVLRDAALSQAVQVTKKNPVNWTANEQQKDWYFASAIELSEEYTYGDFGKHVIVRTPSGALSLMPHLKRVVLDDPLLNVDGMPMFDAALKDLQDAAKDGKVIVKFAKHQCQSDCRCTATYGKYGQPSRVFRN
jgi:hypothetical protein